MTPEERQLLAGLFDRIQGAANQQRDREAEAFIADAVRAQPYAPYLLAQTVIVQEQALRAAHDRLQELEAKVRENEAAPPQETSFLGSLGKSIFGSGPQQPAPRSSVPPSGGGYGQGGYAPPPPSYAPPSYGGRPGPGQGPWSQQPDPGAGGGGGFLKGALGAAAGVAGGVLLADGIRNLFSGHNNPFGIGTGVATAGEGSNSSLADADRTQDAMQDQLDDADQTQDAMQDDADDGSDGGFGGSDDDNI